ncbi:MAG: flavin reductase [Pseudomonadales bacterium]
MIVDSAALASMETRYRAAFVNSLSGFKAANLVGTCDEFGHHNLAIMSSTVHIGSNPPLLALVMRPEAAGQHTLQNILSQKYYTLNHVHAGICEAAHQTAARYPREVSEFQAVGLTAVSLEAFPAPFVGESRLRLGMALRDHQVLQINQTHFVIGEILLADVPENIVDEGGGVDIAAADTVALSGLDSYHATERIARLPYAKP